MNSILENKAYLFLICLLLRLPPSDNNTPLNKLPLSLATPVPILLTTFSALFDIPDTLGGGDADEDATPADDQRRLGLPLSAARDVETRHGCPIDRYGDVAQNANQAGHAHRHATLLTFIALLALDGFRGT